MRRREPGRESPPRGAWSRGGPPGCRWAGRNDGSTVHNLQIVAEHEKIKKDFLKLVTTGSAIRVDGMFVLSTGNQQHGEIIAQNIVLYGTADPQEYPLQKKEHSLDFLRNIAHLRMRTNIFGAIFRVRHNLAFAIHKYFHEKGFFYFNTPIITTSDAEGAGKLFEVTTGDNQDFFWCPGESNCIRAIGG